MRARLVVFPIRGRNWCFSRSIDQSTLDSLSAQTPSTLKQLWKKFPSTSSHQGSTDSYAELLIDFSSNKMNRALTGLEKAHPGSFKNKFYGLGLRLLARVKPSEIFLKSISKEVGEVEVACPSSLDARLVRRKLKAYCPKVLPLPNIPFFWIVFRTYSHWRALKGSERLLQLVSDSSETEDFSDATPSRSKNAQLQNPLGPSWVRDFIPS